MIWKIKHKEIKQNVVKQTIINVGDKKEVKKFAWYPIKLNKDIKIWLEKYIEIYEYKECKIKNNYNTLYYINIKLWVLIDKKINYN